MRFSKQERIAALIVLAVIIIALGAFLIIKPAIEDWSAAKKTVASKQAELDEKNTRRATKAPLREQIEQAYKDGEHLADMFFPEFKAYEADDAFRAFLLQAKDKDGKPLNVVVEQVTVSEPDVSTLSPHFFTPANVEYALKTYATAGVQPTEEEAKLAARREALMAALAEEQTIGASVVEFTVSAKSRDDLLRFADEINDYYINEPGGKVRKAVMLGGLELEYEEVIQKYDALIDESEVFMDAEGERMFAEELGIEPPDLKDDEIEEEEEPSLSLYLYNLETQVIFYSIERMQDPKAQLDLQDGKA